MGFILAAAAAQLVRSTRVDRIDYEYFCLVSIVKGEGRILCSEDKKGDGKRELKRKSPGRTREGAVLLTDGSLGTLPC